MNILKLESLYGQDIAANILKEYYSTVLGELIRKRFLSEIRGETYVPYDIWNEAPCLNCYAYKYVEDGIVKLCANHEPNYQNILHMPERYMKISYLDFLSMTRIVNPRCIYFVNRFSTGTDVNEDKEEDVYMCNNVKEILLFNIEHIPIKYDTTPFTYADYLNKYGTYIERRKYYDYIEYLHNMTHK